MAFRVERKSPRIEHRQRPTIMIRQVFCKSLSIFAFFLTLISFASLHSDEGLVLRDRLQRASTGDYLVIAFNKNITLMLIEEKKPQTLTIQEISAPSSRLPKQVNWKDWVQKNAPYHTAWIRYTIDLETGKMLDYYSFVQNTWCDVSQTDSFLPTLLNLHFNKIPQQKRKKVGPPPSKGSPDLRRTWQPPMVFEGYSIPDLNFDAWIARWPKDNSDLSGKIIEVYLPEEGSPYPSYFPYWLQISGLVGKAKLRIIDSGQQLTSPKHITRL